MLLLGEGVCVCWSGGGGGLRSWNEWAAHVGDWGGSWSPSCPSLCIESVPIWLLPQFPPLFKYRPWNCCCCGGLGLPQWVGSPLLSRFWERSQIGLQLFKVHPESQSPWCSYGVDRTRGHYWSTWVPCLRHQHVWSHLCSEHIRSMFRYQVSPACKHIKPIPNCHYLPWELTSSL